jgi:hypothetical protein
MTEHRLQHVGHACAGTASRSYTPSILCRGTGLRSAGSRDFRHHADVGAHHRRHDRSMEIRICLDHLDPPSGRLRRGDAADQPVDQQGQPTHGAEIRFVGWLGLLSAMDRVIGRDRRGG